MSWRPSLLDWRPSLVFQNVSKGAQGPEGKLAPLLACDVLVIEEVAHTAETTMKGAMDMGTMATTCHGMEVQQRRVWFKCCQALGGDELGKSRFHVKNPSSTVSFHVLASSLLLSFTWLLSFLVLLLQPPLPPTYYLLLTTYYLLPTTTTTTTYH